MKTIKDVLKEALKHLTERENGFICLAIDEVNNHKESDHASKELIEETLEYFEANKPSEEIHPEYFNKKQFSGSHSWWNYSKGQVRYINSLHNNGENEKKLAYILKTSEVMEEQRIEFLTYLISTI